MIVRLSWCQMVWSIGPYQELLIYRIFPHNHLRVYNECSKREYLSDMFFGWKCFNFRSKRRTPWLLWADWKVTVSQITTRYKYAEEHHCIKTHQIFKQMGYSCRARLVSLLSAKNRKVRIFTNSSKLVKEDVGWSDESKSMDLCSSSCCLWGWHIYLLLSYH